MKPKDDRVREAVNIRKDIITQNLDKEENIEKIIKALSEFATTGISSTTKINISQNRVLQLNCSNNKQSGLIMNMC
jgi:uncharacterized linocin/CFP29 family protein